MFVSAIRFCTHIFIFFFPISFGVNNNFFYIALLRFKESRRQRLLARTHTRTPNRHAIENGERTMLENIQQKANRMKTEKNKMRTNERK